MTQTVTASVAAEIIGLNVETLRAWLKRGHYKPSDASGGWVRYSCDDLTALGAIAALCRVGLSIEKASQIVRWRDYERAVKFADERCSEENILEEVWIIVIPAGGINVQVHVAWAQAAVASFAGYDSATMVNVSAIRRKVHSRLSKI